MTPTQEIRRLRNLLAKEREARLALKADLATSAEREKQARADVARLKQRLQDLGETEHKAHRRGYRGCDAVARKRMIALNKLGQNYSQIGRRLGFSVATVSLVCRGLYPPFKR